MLYVTHRVFQAVLDSHDNLVGEAVSSDLLGKLRVQTMGGKVTCPAGGGG